VPRLGKDRARRLSVFTGTALAYAIGTALVPRVGLVGDGPHLALGLGLAAFMAAFDLSLVRWVMRRPWRQAVQDLNPASGNWLLFGLMALTAMPWVVSRWAA
jgi:hypothetical protein